MLSGESQFCKNAFLVSLYDNRILKSKGWRWQNHASRPRRRRLGPEKESVLLVDADPQGSALDWAAIAKGDPLFPVMGLPQPRCTRNCRPSPTAMSMVVIDGPPRVYDVARSAIMASDLILIPVQPSPYDVWAAKEIIDLLHEAAVYKPSLKSAFVINRKIVNTAIGRDVVEALSEYPVPVLKT